MNTGTLRNTVVAAGLILGLSGGVDVALAQNFGNPGVVPPDSNEFGNSYGEWSVRWWQWLLSIPNDTNPNFDNDPVSHCTVAQTGQVWFLAGAFPGGPPKVTRSCTIPAGKDLLLPLRNALFGQGLGDCTGPDDCDPNVLRASAAADVGNPTNEVTIDHVKVKNLDQYRVTSPVFSVFLPKDDPVFGLAPGTHSPVVSDGFWLLLNPLSRGHHTIQIKSGTPPFVFDLMYILTVI
jgi:hypothetical protein